MDDAARGGMRILTGAPPGNAPSESRTRAESACVASRKDSGHVWEEQRDGFGELTGKMFCLWCRRVAPMKKFTGMFAPAPVCSRTGY